MRKDPEKSDLVMASIIILVVGGLLVLSALTGARHV